MTTDELRTANLEADLAGAITDKYINKQTYIIKDFNECRRYLEYVEITDREVEDEFCLVPIYNFLKLHIRDKELLVGDYSSEGYGIDYLCPIFRATIHPMSGTITEYQIHLIIIGMIEQQSEVL